MDKIVILLIVASFLSLNFETKKNNDNNDTTKRTMKIECYQNKIFEQPHKN